MSHLRKIISLLAAQALFWNLAPPALSQQPQSPVLRVTTELVLVNVVVRDKKGNLVRDLKKEDFTLFEDNKEQTVSTFDFENVDDLAKLRASEATVTGNAGAANLLKPSSADTATIPDTRDRRMVLLFFDFSAMEPEQVERSVDAAKKFVKDKMQPADLVALVSLSTNMNVDLDFTEDRTKINSVLTAYANGEGEGFQNGATGAAEGAAETGGAFAADDTDFNTFSADRKLLALQSVVKSLSGIPQKKSLIYFSNGISQNGVDNQSTLRAATAAAVKANVSIYPMDMRGLEAFPPGGGAQSASLHGQSGYTGASVQNDLNSNAASQETLSTLAADTGGKAFFDSNDFSGVFSQVEKDTSAYYVLGFSSSNHMRDGKFRHLRVKVNRPDVHIDARSGYYADRDYIHQTREGREQQLDDELASQLPQTDVAVLAGTSYFRRDESHYYLAVSLVVPGSQIPFVQAKDKDNATIDVIGEVRSAKVAVGRLRDTVKLAVDSSQQVRRKNVQYNTGFILAPGNFHLKFIVRENQTGKMGSFEADVRIPDLRKVPLRMSSVVLASQRVPANVKKNTFDPLVQNQTELVPNVTHVFSQDQHLYLQYEVYDPGRGKTAAADTPANADEKNAPKLAKDGIRIMSSIEFLQSNTKVYESAPVVADQVTAADRKAVIFQIDLPLQSLKPGLYTCQINVVDDMSGNFAFPRWPIMVKEGAAAQARRRLAKPTSPGK